MLQERGYSNLVKITSATPKTDLNEALNKADFIFHLAGANRPKNNEDYNEINYKFTKHITNYLLDNKKSPPIVLSSSSQADKKNIYGKSKLFAEDEVKRYADLTKTEYYIYRFPNVFGKWCRPNYNSFIATFCYNIINNINITINDPNASVRLIYIDDVCKHMISLLSNEESSGYQSISPEYISTVGEVANMLRSFKDSRNTLIIDSVGVGFKRALYSTFISYMKPNQFSYKIPSHDDERGVFSEVLKTKNSGQFSFFTALPGITRGGHYHHSKNEKFLVLKGKALFKFKNIFTLESHEIKTNDRSIEVIETVPGWSHDITNIGEDDLIVMLWANEIFDKDLPDTYSFDL